MDRLLERELIKKSQENIQAFEEIYNHYLPKIYSYLLNQTRQRELAEDLTSEVFARALASLGNYDERGISFAAWLFRVARNVLIDFIRRKKEIPVDPISIRESAPPSQISSPLEDIERAEKNALARFALLHIPEKYRTILSLKFFEELSNEEIAEVMSCSTNAVAVKIHRGLKMAKKYLAKLSNISAATKWYV